MNAPSDSNDNQPNRPETLAERSARLEAEAKALYEKNSDPLAPEPETRAAAEADSEIVAALRAEVEAMKDQMLRAAADAENTKRRALKERDDAKKFSIANFSRDLLNVADNLRRALDAFPDDARQDIRIANLIEGIEATERELLRNFERNGITKMNALDQVFDPNFHEVMFEAAVPGKTGGTIVQIIMDGYMIHDRLLRPAQVGVAKDDGSAQAPQPAAPSSSDGIPPQPNHKIDTQA